MEDINAMVAKLGKALSDEKRVALLRFLMSPGSSECCGLPSTAAEGICNCELQQLLNSPQATVSYHVRILREANLITERPRGKWTYVALNPEMTDTLSNLFERIGLIWSDDE